MLRSLLDWRGFYWSSLSSPLRFGYICQFYSLFSHRFIRDVFAWEQWLPWGCWIVKETQNLYLVVLNQDCYLNALLAHGCPKCTYAYEFLSCESFYILPFVVLPASLNLGCCYLCSWGKEENPISSRIRLGVHVPDPFDLGEAEQPVFWQATYNF